MKKIILLASALAFGGVAYAQDTTQPTTPDASSTMPATPDATTPPSTPDASMPADSSATPPAAGDQSMTPPAADPSAAQAPMPATQPGTATGPNGPVSMTPTQGSADLPMCSKSVTDNCKQGGSGGKHAMRHKRHK